MSSYWQKRREPIGHADDWLMTYADMITLLLCFFAVFLAMAYAKKDPPPKPQDPPAIEQPVAPINIPDHNLPFHELTDADFQEDSATAAPPPPLNTPVDARLDTMPPEAAPLADKKDNAPPSILNNTVSLPEIVDHLKTEGPANIEQKGDRLTTLEMNSAAFFGSGSATLSEAGMAVLRDVAANIKSDRFRDYQITVEGHTDDTPIKTLQFPSNWELSTARASAVVHFFLEQGVPAQRLRAAGYADTFPKFPNRDAAGNSLPQNQAQNRRVVIKLEKVEKQI